MSMKGATSAPLRLAIPDLVSPSYFPAIAAVELGLFKAEGLDARLELIYPVTKSYEELRDGRLDFVGGAAHAALYAFKDWRGGKLLCALAQHMYWFLVVRADLAAKRGDPSVVRGLRIGAAPGPVDGLRQMLREAGIDPEREVKIGPVPIGGGVSFGVTAAKALEDGKIDGFWGNAMGAAVAVRSGIGAVVIDARRADGPPAAQHYTFPAFVTTEKKIDEQREVVAAAVRAIVAAQRALKEDPERATGVGKKLFPATEAGLIAELVRRDAPFYDPAITAGTVAAMNRFARDLGILSGPAPYEQVVAPQFQRLWAS
jgi:ABC-type nitrate/sulfonate/bicarbonate transport system substrate-binding protein